MLCSTITTVTPDAATFLDQCIDFRRFQCDSARAAGSSSSTASVFGASALAISRRLSAHNRALAACALIMLGDACNSIQFSEVFFATLFSPGSGGHTQPMPAEESTVHLRCAPIITFFSGTHVLPTCRFWQFRLMPLPLSPVRLSWCDVAWPSIRSRLRLAGRLPLIRVKQCGLAAPFGPITE